MTVYLVLNIVVVWSQHKGCVSNPTFNQFFMLAWLSLHSYGFFVCGFLICLNALLHLVFVPFSSDQFGYFWLYWFLVGFVC